MIRRHILEMNDWRYDEHHKAVEDYGLWIKISNKYKVQILPEMLLKYRLNTNGIMSNENKNVMEMLKNRSVIYKELLVEKKIVISDNDILDYTVFVNGYDRLINIECIIKLLVEIRRKIINQEIYDIKLFDDFVSGLYRGYNEYFL